MLYRTDGLIQAHSPILTPQQSPVLEAALAGHSRKRANLLLWIQSVFQVEGEYCLCFPKAPYPVEFKTSAIVSKAFLDVLVL